MLVCLVTVAKPEPYPDLFPAPWRAVVWPPWLMCVLRQCAFLRTAFSITFTFTFTAEHRGARSVCREWRETDGILYERRLPIRGRLFLRDSQS